MKQHRPRPAKKTAIIDVRLSDELKTAFMAQCQEDDETVSAVLRRFITAHLRARAKQKAAQRLIRSLLTMFGSLRMLLASGATGGAAVAAAVMLAPVAVHVSATPPTDGPMVSAQAPSEGSEVVLLSVDPTAPATGPEVTPMEAGQVDGAVSLATEVTATR